MWSYDATDYDPPAPVAQVILRNVDSGEMVADVLLLLDTGADVTLLPRDTIEQLGVQPVACHHRPIGTEACCADCALGAAVS